MPVKITQYKYEGRWGPFKIDEPCRECDVTTGVLKDMMKKELKGLDVVLEIKPWLDNWIYCLSRGAWHAPIIMVDNNKFYQYSEKEPLFNREKLKEAIIKRKEKLKRKEP